jgi:NAD(P)-dependent dehydrogenase (short-subunit alcohol dehydrogenase family)
MRHSADELARPQSSGSFGFLRGTTLPPHINMTARPKTYLVTGANRGLGFGYVTALLARDNVVVYAGARDPSRSTHLQDLQKTHANLHILKISSADKEDNLAAAREVEKVSGYLDVLVANAGESGVLYTGRLLPTNHPQRQASPSTGPRWSTVIRPTWSATGESIRSDR